VVLVDESDGTHRQPASRTRQGQQLERSARVARILYVAPLRVDAPRATDATADGLRPGNSLTRLSFTRGPRHLEYHYYETLVLPDLLHTLVEAERQGYDAAVIGCFYDLGLQEGREVTSRLVVTAPCESSLHLAATLGHRFSIIVGRRKWIPQMHDTVRRYGLESRLASFRAIDLWVPQYHEDGAETARRFREAGRRAIEEDGAEVIVFGCTASAGFYARLQEELGVPVIDSALAAIKYAEHLVEVRDRFGWSHSKLGGYEAPPAAELDAWRLREQYQPGDIRDLWVDHSPVPNPAD
jgi:allantoin racemase